MSTKSLFTSWTNKCLYTLYRHSTKIFVRAPWTQWTHLHRRRAAIAKMPRNTAPSKDRITNPMIRNLSDEALQTYTTFKNEHWQQGTIPGQWKHAQIVFPSLARNWQLIRPISPTSCLGELFERIVNSRLQNYLEDNEIILDTMLGFRPKLSRHPLTVEWIPTQALKTSSYSWRMKSWRIYQDQANTFSWPSS